MGMVGGGEWLPKLGSQQEISSVVDLLSWLAIFNSWVEQRRLLSPESSVSPTLVSELLAHHGTEALLILCRRKNCESEPGGRLSINFESVFDYPLLWRSSVKVEKEMYKSTRVL